jgi:hypothetical protein
VVLKHLSPQGFFGMNFFSMSDQSRLQMTTDIWIFFLIIGVSTVVTLGLWVMVHYRGWRLIPRPPKRTPPPGLKRAMSGF